MADSVITERCLDVGILYNIVNREDIFCDIAEDEAPPVIPEVVNEYWLLLFVGEDVIGCYRVHALSSCLYQGHAFVLPEFRKEHSKGSLKSVAGWCLQNIESMKKMNCDVPEKFKHVQHFLLNAGFKPEGVCRAGWTKDGQAMDVCRFGATVEELRLI